MSGPLIIFVELEAIPGEEARLREGLLGLIEPTRAEAGCLTYDVLISEEHPGRMGLLEVWESAAHHAAHERSEHLRAFASRREELIQAPLRVARFSRARGGPEAALL